MKLRKIVLHEGNEVLQQNEMKMIRGGETSYNCRRFKQVDYNVFVCYTFTCPNEDFKNNWTEIWTMLDWEVICEKNDGSDPNIHLC